MLIMVSLEYQIFVSRFRESIMELEIQNQSNNPVETHDTTSHLEWGEHAKITYFFFSSSLIYSLHRNHTIPQWTSTGYVPCIICK